MVRLKSCLVLLDMAVDLYLLAGMACHEHRTLADWMADFCHTAQGHNLAALYQAAFLFLYCSSQEVVGFGNLL